ncbi:MAG: Hsp20 family protein [Candidatus Liberibacter ctenarytainae]|uniref:Hsp20 family protein n=1 Tax=Candidatus Liberibacter ctenarytainae TaxID=2020335 RepID=A0A937AEI1_9HYPH|nr:Hsp20 family protein [Candidatus Liberibacter ctenarytainae]
MRINLSRIHNSAIGYDSIFSSVLDDLGSPSQSSSYPPYDIGRTGENKYRITIAVAGFDCSELSIEADTTTLMVRGEKRSEEKDVEYLHRGIARRAFEHRFQLADFVEVKSASLENGLLYLELLRNIPEKMKPRRIEILQSSKEPEKMIESQKLVAA